MWCLLCVFPFLVAAKVPRDDRHMNLILLLLRILEIVMAPKLTNSLMPYLQQTIREFFQVFKKLFADIKFINKFHHMDHYPEYIEAMGPLVHNWCMRYEAKHAPTKERAHVVHNFQNIPKTLIRESQCAQSAMWGAGDVELGFVKSEGGKVVLMEETLSQLELQNLGYVVGDKVFRTNSVRVNGVLFEKILLFAWMQKESQESTFLYSVLFPTY